MKYTVGERPQETLARNPTLKIRKVSCPGPGFLSRGRHMEKPMGTLARAVSPQVALVKCASTAWEETQQNPGTTNHADSSSFALRRASVAGRSRKDARNSRSLGRPGVSSVARRLIAQGATGKKPRASWTRKFLDNRGKPSRNARREETQGTLAKSIRFLDTRSHCTAAR